MIEQGVLARAGAASLALVVGALASCRELPLEEQIERRRAQYQATVNSISFPERPAETSIVESTAEPVTLPGPIDVVLDVLVSTEAAERLPGLTLDVSHADQNGKEKEHRLLWIDTARIERGGGVQLTLTLEDVDYAEGDGFHVEVRSPVPPEERQRYREFDQRRTPAESARRPDGSGP